MSIRCIARGEVAAGQFVTAYTVPPASVVLLKSVVFTNQATADTRVQIALSVPGEATFVRVDMLEVPAEGQAMWNGWVAANAGDDIRLWTDAHDVFYWVSGSVET
jgi:hypothetical protein